MGAAVFFGLRFATPSCYDNLVELQTVMEALAASISQSYAYSHTKQPCKPNKLPSRVSAGFYKLESKILWFTCCTEIVGCRIGDAQRDECVYSAKINCTLLKKASSPGRRRCLRKNRAMHINRSNKDSLIVAVRVKKLCKL